VGDELLREWRGRVATRGTAYVFGYYELHFTRESRLVLDSHNRNRFGDPQPRIDYRMDAATRAREAATREHWAALFARMARAGNGSAAPAVFADDKLNHPTGGCRMGTNPAESVCDSYGQTHDHPNLFVVGAATLPTAGCTNGALTFSALALRSAVRIRRRLKAPPA
jgi:quinoprotein glucose dehydrogenase